MGCMPSESLYLSISLNITLLNSNKEMRQNHLKKPILHRNSMALMGQK